MYDIETLARLNVRFLSRHIRLHQSDVDMANAWVRRIESTRDATHPVELDSLRYYNEYGDYYERAMIFKVEEDGTAEVCEQPWTPFVYEHDRKVRGSASGGAWTHIPVEDMRYVGREKRKFTGWGHCGGCADGAVDFEAVVNVWEYHAPFKRFGEYSTKDRNRMFVHYREEPSDFGYHWIGDGYAWKTEEDYVSWLMTYKGVEFAGNWENQTVVFTYKTAKHLISKAEWDALALPTDTHMMNGSILLVKYEYDDESHIIHEYRHSNSGALDWSENKPFRVAHGKLAENPSLLCRVIMPQNERGEL